MKLNIRFLVLILVLAFLSILLSSSLYISTIEIIGFMSVSVVLAVIFKSRKLAAVYNIIIILVLQLADAFLEYMLALWGHHVSLLPSFGKYLASYYEGGALVGIALMALIVTICIVDMTKKLEERGKQRQF